MTVENEKLRARAEVDREIRLVLNMARMTHTTCWQRVGDSQVRVNPWQIVKSPLGELLIAPTPSPPRLTWCGSTAPQISLLLAEISFFLSYQRKCARKKLSQCAATTKVKRLLLPILPIRGSAQHLPLGVSFKWNSALKGTVGKRPEKNRLKA